MINSFQPSDAMWRNTFNLSLIRMSFAQRFQCFAGAATAAPTKHARTITFVHMLGNFSIFSRA
jgi:hypothetical protein